MGSIFREIKDKGLMMQSPSFIDNNIHYEVMMGSFAYGVSDDTSDIDVYGFCIPQKNDVFPHLRGVIPGFGKQGTRFEQFQQHHIEDKTKGKEYDITIYSIIKYFQLCMENNPNMIDSLFVPSRCIIFSTYIGDLVRENRHIFLHKGAWHKFKGYAYSQVHKIKTKVPVGKRCDTIEKFGYDVKFGYHTVRLLNEVEQILTEGDLDLERNREQLKAIRRGDWAREDIEKYFVSKEKDLETCYTNSKLPYSPNEADIKALLLKCLEYHYGSIDHRVACEDTLSRALISIDKILNSVRCIL